MPCLQRLDYYENENWLVMELLKNWLRGPKDLDHFVSGGGSLGGSSVQARSDGRHGGRERFKACVARALACHHCTCNAFARS